MRDEIMSGPIETVSAFFIRPNGEVLLGLRASWKKAWPLHWDAIGGRVEDNESLEVALVREVREELGVTPTVFERIESMRERRPELYGDALHHLYAVTRWVGGEPENACDEHSEIRWFTVGEMRLLESIVDGDYPRYAQRAIETMPEVRELGAAGKKETGS